MRLRTLCLSLLCASSAAAQAPTNVRMQNVVKLFVQRTGQQLIGLGSWISGTNYKDVLADGASDHDLRLVIQRSGVTPAQAQQEWQAARRVLKDLVTQEFGKDAAKVLGATNLYAPNQLMKGVEDAADAMQRFQKLGQVPNLAYSGSVNSATPKFLAEGLYGEGAGVWTQMYEQKSGRLFYAVEGRAYAGMVDLTHLAEGQGRYTVEGMANTSTQWAEHAAEELSQNRGDRVAKYLERLERDMAKAKDLARLGGDPSWTREIREVTASLKANPRSLAQLEGRVAALLQRTHLESAILGRLAKAGPVQGAVLNAAMAGIAAKNQFGQALTTAAQKIPAMQLVQGVLAIVVVKSGSRAAAESGYLEALRQAAPVMATLGTGVLMGLTNAIMDGAREGGFALAASYQDPWALLEGNFTAAGRVSADEGRPYTIEELVLKIHTEDALSNFVRTRAQQASLRGFQGTVSAATDQSVANDIYARCFPQILRAWQTRRELLRMEYLDLADGLKTAVYPVVVSPSSAKLTKGGKVDVLAEVLPPKNSTLGRSLDRMKEILTILVGGRPYALVTYRWVGGQDGNRETQRTYTFRQAGTQSVVCTVEISVNESSLRAGDPLIQRIPRFTAVDVDIEGEIAMPKVEIYSITLGIRVQPWDSGLKNPTDPKAFNQLGHQTFPDLLDSRTLPLTTDGTFSYSGLTSYQYSTNNKRTSYSGRVDLESWTVTVSGTFSDGWSGKGFFGAFSESYSGDFTVTIPMCPQSETKRSLVKIRGTVSTTYQDEQNGGRSQKLPLTMNTGRRLTDDVTACVAWRNPEALHPDYTTIGGPEMYEGGEGLWIEKYRQYRGMFVFGNHVVDKSLFRFNRRTIILPGTAEWASVAAAAASQPAGAPAASTAPAGAAPAGGAPPAKPSPTANAPTTEAPTSFSVDTPVPPANTLTGSGEVSGAFVTLTNAGKTHWTRCVITLPGQRSFKSGTVPMMTGRDYPLTEFRTDAGAPALSGEALVQCVEGSLRFRVQP